MVAVKSGITLDFETTSSYEVTMIVTDSAGATASTPFTINVLDVNEVPVINAVALSLDENLPAGTSVGTVTASDPEIDNGVAQQLYYKDTRCAITLIVPSLLL